MGPPIEDIFQLLEGYQAKKPWAQREWLKSGKITTGVRPGEVLFLKFPDSKQPWLSVGVVWDDERESEIPHAPVQDGSQSQS